MVSLRPVRPLRVFDAWQVVFFLESSKRQKQKKRVSGSGVPPNVQRCAVVIVHHGTSIFQS